MAGVTRSEDRLAVLAKIEEYERAGLFDRDVENDPPTRPLRAGEVDYLAEKRATRVGTKFANAVARRWFEKRIARGELVLDGVTGIENFRAVGRRGALLVCNHFNPFDNYAVYKAIEKDLGGHDLWKVIREGNYTSFPGFFGYLFRHCNTLPLAQSFGVMREMTHAVEVLLARGEKILIYPEQAMWWNYKKPRPVKAGAIHFAVRSGAPVVPVFITLRPTDRLGRDGFPILAYTVHILPHKEARVDETAHASSRRIAGEVYDAWCRVYTETYGEEPTYSTEGEVPKWSI